MKPETTPESIKIGNEEIVVDTARLAFNDASLHVYLEEEASWYDFFGGKLADIEYLVQRQELVAEAKYSEKFVANKNTGASDKMAESMSKCDPEIIDIKEKIAIYKRNMKRIQQHLKAWDKNHENANSRGHFIRKEMDKLNYEMLKSGGHESVEQELEKIIDESQSL